MLTYTQLQAQTMGLRAMIEKLLGAFEGRENEIPEGWNNNARWHAGHLVTTPQLLVRGLSGDALAVPEDYRKWFAKGTSPREWGSDPVPPFAQLRREMLELNEALLNDFKDRQDTPFAKPYTTSTGVILTSPAESFAFSQAHDGIHLGMLMALKRSLKI